MKKAMFSALVSTASIICLVLLLLWFVGDARFIPSLGNPRLWVAAGILFLSMCGLYFVFRPSFLRKYLGLSLVLPLVWFATFTWAYGYLYLPESNHLGDYYGISFLLFTLPYIFYAWKWKFKLFSPFFSVLEGLFSFVMVVIPLVYIGYYVIYKSEMDLFAMMAISMTNADETLQFIRTVASPLYIGLTAAFLILLFVVCQVVSFRSLSSLKCISHSPLFSTSKYYLCGLAVITILFTGGFVRQMMHVFPIGMYRTIQRKDSSFQLLQTMKTRLAENEKNIEFLPGLPIAAGTHILVIGESACRDHMQAFTPSYPEKTTPWESEMTASPDFFFTRKAYANFPTTVMSLSFALTSTNQYSDGSLKNAVSLVDAAKKAGYRTDWISFQNRSSLASAGVSVIGERCDATYWENSLDGEAVNVMKKLPPADKRVIFIHINGSHYNYASRVPFGYGKETLISSDDPYYDYDVTLSYTDKMLHEIFDYAKANLNLQTMIYFSDHGEDMVHYHGTSPFTYDMVHIPLWIYISPEWRALCPSVMPALERNRDKLFTNDLIFDLASNLWQAKTNYYEAVYDLSSPEYGLDRQALTMHGRFLVTDDPVFKK